MTIYYYTVSNDNLDDNCLVLNQEAYLYNSSFEKSISSKRIDVSLL